MWSDLNSPEIIQALEPQRMRKIKHVCFWMFEVFVTVRNWRKCQIQRGSDKVFLRQGGRKKNSFSILIQTKFLWGKHRFSFFQCILKWTVLRHFSHTQLSEFVLKWVEVRWSARLKPNKQITREVRQMGFWSSWSSSFWFLLPSHLFCGKRNRKKFHNTFGFKQLYVLSCWAMSSNTGCRQVQHLPVGKNKTGNW